MIAADRLHQKELVGGFFIGFVASSTPCQALCDGLSVTRKIPILMRVQGFFCDKLGDLSMINGFIP